MERSSLEPRFYLKLYLELYLKFYLGGSSLALFRLLFRALFPAPFRAPFVAFRVTVALCQWFTGASVSVCAVSPAGRCVRVVANVRLKRRLNIRQSVRGG